MSFSDLPQEIVDIIARNLASSKLDLKAFRLANSKACSATNRFLFDSVTISCHPLDLDIFKCIVNHGVINQCVRELRWDNSTFHYATAVYDPNSEQFPAQWAALRQAREYQDSLSIPQGTSVSNYLEKSKERLEFWGPIARQHKEIRKHDLHTQALNDALQQSRLKQIKRLKYCSRDFMSSHFTDTRYHDAKPNLLFETPTRRLYRTRFPEDLPLKIPHFAPQSMPQGDRSHSVESPDHSLDMLLKCFVRAKFPLEELIVDADACEHNNFMKEMVVLYGPTARWCDNKSFIFEHLRRLEIPVPYAEDIKQYQLLPQMFEAIAQNIEEIQIKWNWYDEAHLLDALIEHNTFAKLSAFSIQGGVVTLAILKDFLVRHASTLRHFVILDFDVEGGEFKSFVRNLKELRNVIRLEDVQMNVIREREDVGTDANYGMAHSIKSEDRPWVWSYIYRDGQYPFNDDYGDSSYYEDFDGNFDPHEMLVDQGRI
ncbi:hypothetical protein MMC25_004765 [Agyrium rufum]|nr:hypothetical protein [Agyrium rufum]